MSVVIVTHNEQDRLKQTVESFLATLPARGTEIIVVDDQSDDGSSNFLSTEESSSLRLVRTPRRLGISGARNLGASLSTGTVLIFSDAHVRVHPGWSEPLYDTALKPFVGAVAPTVHSMNEPGIAGFGFTWRDASLKMNWLKQRGAAPYAVPFLCGCFIAMRRDIFRVTGGFDEGLITWGSEDAEISLRLWRMGYECQVAPKSAISHLFRKRFPYEVKWEGILHNTLRLATIHFGKRALSQVVGHYRKHAAFGGASARLSDSDVWRRRNYVREISRFEDQWLFDRFRISALT
jgi:polypeptide N-acetylgalactosaminyltransferase